MASYLTGKGEGHVAHFCVLCGSWGSTLHEMRLNHSLSVCVGSRQGVTGHLST